MTSEERSAEVLTERHSSVINNQPTAEPIDLPNWSCYLVVFCSSCSLWLSLFISDPTFLTSSVGFVDGGDMYSHIAESIHLKKLIQSGYTDFWYPFVTLGYPMFLAYQPLPCMITAAVMILFDGFLSPLLIFRWLLVIVVSLFPVAWFIAGRWLGMTNLESTVLSLLVYSVQSWRKFGLELAALSNYGLNTQIWGIIFLPITVGSLYQHIVLNKTDGILPVVMVTLNGLIHSFHGVYAAIATAVMVAVYWLSNFSLSGLFCIRPVMFRTLSVFSKSLALLSWWLVPFILNMQYMGGLPWRTDSEEGYQLGFIIKQFLSGEIFDSGRTIPFLTILVLWGIACVCIKETTTSAQDSNRTLIHLFIGMLLVVSFVLFLGRTMFGSLYNLIPFHSELEVIRYLSGLHFCGLILASISLSRFIRFVSSKIGVTCSNLYKQQVLVVVILLVAPVSISLDVQYLNEHVHMTEVSHGPQQAFTQFRDYAVPGRVYGNKDLGIQDHWKFAFVPQLTEKPGILTYSRGYHDSLSMYYVECLKEKMDLQAFPWLPKLLRLYNIRYLMSAGISYDPRFVKGCQLKTVVDSVGFFVHQVNTNISYGYFDFVRLPGAIYGDTKKIRNTVQNLLSLIQSNVLLFINPEKQHLTQVKVLPAQSVNILDRLNSEQSNKEEWSFSGLDTTEKDFLSALIKRYSASPVMSRIVEEKENLNSYQALVDVSQENKSVESQEYLLLKVTYHPYWTCLYSTLSVDKDSPLSSNQNRTWQQVPVHHVIPCMMAVLLPTGHHLVRCQYHCPVHVKVLAVVCISVLLALIVKIVFRKDNKSSRN